MSAFNAKEAGRATIRTSINRPIPFWPSLEPWAKLTPGTSRSAGPEPNEGLFPDPLVRKVQGFSRTFVGVTEF
jgi:hypothetical protein